MRRPALYALLMLVALAAAVGLIARTGPGQGAGPNGYLIAARYFSAPSGGLGSGLNILRSSAPLRAIRKAADRGAQVAVVASPSSLRALHVRGRLVPAPTWVRPDWPDPVTAGVRRLRLAGGATCLAGSQAPPIVGTRSCVVLSFVPLGRGGAWLLADPSLFTNAGIVLPGHLQVLANMARQAGGLRFAVWHAAPPPPARTPGALVPRAWLVDLLPALLALLWVLGARFGPVRAPLEASADADSVTGLADLLRRHQAGRAALAALVGGPLAGGAPDAVSVVRRRLAGGPIRGREASRLFRLLRGGEDVGRERDR